MARFAALLESSAVNSLLEEGLGDSLEIIARKASS